MDSWTEPDTYLEYGLPVSLIAWLINRSLEMVEVVKDRLWDLSNRF